jgi:hypothetical protein
MTRSGNFIHFSIKNFPNRADDRTELATPTGAAILDTCDEVNFFYPAMVPLREGKVRTKEFKEMPISCDRN